MLSSRLPVAVFLLSLAALGFAACFAGPTIGAHKTTSAHASGAASAGAGAATTSSGAAGAGGGTAAGTGGTSAGTGGAGGKGAGTGGVGNGSAGVGTSTSTGGKGGLVKGAMCGMFTSTNDAGTVCAAGLSCCPNCPPPGMGCDTYCETTCDPNKDPGCAGGCMFMP